jgi:uncharacterized membrane protein
MIHFHTVNGVIALLTGLLVLLLPKGTVLHRSGGYVYVASMVLLCVASFRIRDSTPFFHGLGMFHVMALVSLGTLIAGLLPMLRRPRSPNAYRLHFRFMAWSYIGLVMATNSHMVRPLFLWLRDGSGSVALALLLTVLFAWVLPPVVGKVLITRGEAGSRFLAPSW